MSMSRVVHNPIALVEAEKDYLLTEAALLRRQGRHRTDRFKEISGRLAGLMFALAAFRDGCVPQPECPHSVLDKLADQIGSPMAADSAWANPPTPADLVEGRLTHDR